MSTTSRYLNSLTTICENDVKKIFPKNSKVSWKWLGRSIQGKVLESYTETISKTIKTKKIVRHGSAENPAYLVCSEAGNEALKLHSELEKGAKPASSSKKPKMFSE